MEKRIFFAAQIILAVIACVYVGLKLWDVSRNSLWQWDFRTYYYATITASAGENPYDTSAVSRTTGHHIRWTFLYPPTALYILHPLSTFEYGTSYFLFLGAKLLALIGLVVLWMRIFPKETGKNERLVFIITLCLGYRQVLLWDIQTGNISIFEQLFLWLGIYLFLRRESFAGYGSIVIGSLFKVVPILFLPLLLLLKRSFRNLMYCIAAVLLFGAALVLPYRIDPTLFGHFMNDLQIRDERGRHNPSSLAFFKDVIDMIGAPEIGAYILYGLFVLVLLLLLYPAFRKLEKRATLTPADRDLALISLLVTAYTLLLPRMKDYSFIIMLMPALFIIRDTFQSLRFRMAACALLWIPLGWYHPFFLTLFFLICMYVRIMREGEDHRNRRADTA